MWAVYALLISFWHLSSSEDCHVHVTQNIPIPRPEGRAVFTCDIQGVSYQQLRAYRWFIAGYDTPVFTNLISINKITVSKRYASMYIDENFSSGRLQSTLQVQLNITNAYVFKCEANTSDGKLCANSIRAQFRDPGISMFSSSDIIPKMSPGETTRVSMMCAVDISAGVPVLDISYRPTNQHEFLAEKQAPEITRHNLYYSGKQRGDLFVEEGGEIVCTVNDSLGTYRATHDIAIKGCPPSIHLRIGQYAPIQRPTDRVELTSTVTGVSLPELLYYRWLIHDTDEILYTFSEIFTATKTTVMNSAMSPNETHETSSRWIESKLKMRINMSFSQIIRFDMKTKNNDLCFMTTRIVVAEPKITLTVNNISGVSYTSREDEVLLVACSIDAALGKPRFLLEANGDILGISSNKATYEKRDFYYHGLAKATFTVSQGGRILCIVRDELGTYTENNIIHTEDSGSGFNLKLLGLISLALLIFIPIGMFWSTKRRHKSWFGIQSKTTSTPYFGSSLTDAESREPLVNQVELQLLKHGNLQKQPSHEEHWKASLLSDMKKPDTYIYLVWAYNNKTSKDTCFRVKRAFSSLGVSVQTKKPRNQSTFRLLDKSGHHFILLIWDEAAATDDEFTSVVVHANLLQYESEDVTCFNIVLDRESQHRVGNNDVGHRCVPWFEDHNSNDMDALALKILDHIWQCIDPQRQFDVIVDGLVWSYYSLHLKTLLTDLNTNGRKQQWRRANDNKFLADKFFIIIPKSGKCDVPFEKICEKGCYHQGGALCSISFRGANTASHSSELYVHSVKLKGHVKEYHFVGEYASYVDILEQLDEDEIILHKSKLINMFEFRLRNLLKLQNLQDSCEIIAFDDEDYAKKLNNEIVHLLQSPPNISKSKVSENTECNVHILHRCKYRNACENHTCRIMAIKSTLSDGLSWRVIDFNFIQPHIFRSHSNDTLCFIWDKYTSKDATMRACMDFAKSKKYQTVHIEIDEKSLPPNASKDRTVQCHFKDPDASKWRHQLRRDLNDIILRQKVYRQYNMFGVSLALPYFYSYLQEKMTGWHGALELRKRDYKQLHGNLIIIVPLSGRITDHIPGCSRVSRDVSTGSSGGKSQGKPPIQSTWSFGGVKTSYTNHVYRIDTRKINHAAIEYAYPVETLQTICNSCHLTSGIETFYRELNDLIFNAAAVVSENVDLILLDDVLLHACSDYDYDANVASGLKSEILQRVID